MSDDIFQRYSAYYDLLYRDKDYTAEAEYIGRTLRVAAPNTRSILEFGSGTGRHACLLATDGFEVVGIERSPSMVSKAKQAAEGLHKDERGKFECAQGDIRDYEAGRLFDSVISIFHVVSYQTHNCDVLQTFANANRHLRPKGLFLFDVWHGPAVISERPSVRVKQVEDDNVRLYRIAEPVTDHTSGVVSVRYTLLAESKSDGSLNSFIEEHKMRYFSPTEIHLLADQTGFDVIRTEEFLSGNTLSEHTWGAAYLLQKRD